MVSAPLTPGRCATEHNFYWGSIEILMFLGKNSTFSMFFLLLILVGKAVGCNVFQTVPSLCLANGEQNRVPLESVLFEFISESDF
jgi:hypothetical protein